MDDYFARVVAPLGGPFVGGLGWIDGRGIERVSTNPMLGSGLNLSDRSYFKQVIATDAPFVSEGLAARGTRKHIVVMAVPTHDARGRLTGVLAGALLVNAFAISRGSVDLGFAGLSVLDRNGRAVLDDFSRPRNLALLRRLQQTQVGLLPDARGLDGRGDHLVAYATATIPGWTIVIDRPRSAVFAAARRGLLLELALIAAAAAVAFCVIGWLLLRARREADRQSARARQRDELSHALGAASFAAEVSKGLAAALSAAFPDALSVVALEAEDRLGLALAAVQGRVLSDTLVPDLVTAHATTVAYESGTPFGLPTEACLREQLPEVHAACDGAVRSLYCAPLRAAGARAIGALCLLFADERALDEKERAHVAWCAEEAAQALDRARSYEHEHAVAVSLQRSLLSQDLPEIEGVELLGRYQAGSAGLEVGGDWYDVVRRSDGIVHITVGDVAGRGVTAAVLMGQMRNAFRAYAYDHASPAEVLRRMRRHIDGEEMATAVCLTLDPYTQELTYASAGHPPVAAAQRQQRRRLAARSRRRAPARLRTGRDDPRGRHHRPGTLHPDRVHRRPDRASRLEHRRRHRPARRRARASHALDPTRLAAKIVEDVAATVDSGDDIALLIVRLAGVPARMDIEIPSDPRALAGVRRRLRAWLELRGLGEEERNDAVLSVSEACNNAIEHGYRGGAGAIRLVLDHRAGALEITIEDQGSWRDPTPTPDRGRGLQIMRAVMHDAKIEHAAHGTRVVLTRRLVVRSR